MAEDHNLIEELVSALYLERSTIVIWADATQTNCTVTIRKPHSSKSVNNWLDHMEEEDISVKVFEYLNEYARIEQSMSFRCNKWEFPPPAESGWFSFSAAKTVSESDKPYDIDLLMSSGGVNELLSQAQPSKSPQKYLKVEGVIYMHRSYIIQMANDILEMCKKNLKKLEDDQIQKVEELQFQRKLSAEKLCQQLLGHVSEDKELSNRLNCENSKVLFHLQNAFTPYTERAQQFERASVASVAPVAPVALIAPVTPVTAPTEGAPAPTEGAPAPTEGAPAPIEGAPAPTGWFSWLGFGGK